jgi:uncharacterized membrane protein
MMSSKKHLAKLHSRIDVFGAHGVNVNDVHQRTLSRNDRIAMWVADHVGTMWFCYGLAVVMIAWAILQEVILPWFGMRPFDPYSFPFLFFVLGGVMQSLLLPLIMVAQNQSTRHSELRAESDHMINQESFDRLEQIISHLSEQDKAILSQTQLIEQLVSKPKPTTRKKAEVKNGE